MCRSFTCKRGTRRWPLSIFFTLIDMSALNSQTICAIRNIMSISDRKEFLRSLGFQLVSNYIRSRHVNGLQSRIVSCLNTLILRCNKVIQNQISLVEVNSNKVNEDETRSKRKCEVCADEQKINRNKKVKRSNNVCSDCDIPVCKDHFVLIRRCNNCVNNLDENSNNN